MQITKQDFDNAVKQEWSIHTCILAQFSIKVCGGIGLPHYVIDEAIEELFYSTNAESVLEIFDRYFHAPGDENKPELQTLRASLPITI